MKLSLNPKEEYVVLAALELLRTTKMSSPGQQVNRYDMLSSEHSIMHSVALMAKMTNQPVAYFMNPLQKTEEK